MSLTASVVEPNFFLACRKISSSRSHSVSGRAATGFVSNTGRDTGGQPLSGTTLLASDAGCTSSNTTRNKLSAWSPMYFE